jgi:hypothetical protein
MASSVWVFYSAIDSRSVFIDHMRFEFLAMVSLGAFNAFDCVRASRRQGGLNKSRQSVGLA